MRYQWKNRNFYLMLFADAVLFALAHVVAYLFRFEFELSRPSLQQIQMVLPYLVPFKLAIFFASGLYRGMWRYTGLRDIWRLAQASFFSTIVIVAVGLFLLDLRNFSRAVFLLDGVLTFLLAGGLRIGIRFYFTTRIELKTNSRFYPSQMRGQKNEGKRVLIIGAGDAGEKMLREIFDNPQLRYQVVGFLDDDARKHGCSMHGVPVLGSVPELPKIVEKHDVQEIFIAIPSATGSQMRRTLEICKNGDVPYKTLPGIGDIMEGRVSIKALRDVNYADLLGRPLVQLDMAGIQYYLRDRRVLVTGPGGSIGSELCRQIVRFEPQTLILADMSEANLFHIQTELSQEINHNAFQAILGMVQDRSLMEEIFQKYCPHVVFHAAAYKHVPMLERNPWEAVWNNILGSQVTMEMALKYGTERFLLVSTDKAAAPINVMGASKRACELFLQSLQGSRTRFMGVRFGNVLGSSGSVIPLFRRQIERGGPLTVTHPQVTRYFMTIPEAAQLILQAGAMGEGGEIFILEMGTPVKIVDMARDLIRLSGKEPGKDIEIVFTGLRDGEKLYEDLISQGEETVGSKHEKIMLLRPDGNWNGFKSSTELHQWIKRRLEELYQLARQHDAWAVKQKLHEIVPEYTPQLTDSVL